VDNAVVVDSWGVGADGKEHCASAVSIGASSVGAVVEVTGLCLSGVATDGRDDDGVGSGGGNVEEVDTITKAKVVVAACAVEHVEAGTT